MYIAGFEADTNREKRSNNIHILILVQMFFIVKHKFLGDSATSTCRTHPRLAPPVVRCRKICLSRTDGRTAPVNCR
jgi:hypothetical protein